MNIIDNYLVEARSFEKKNSVKAILRCPDNKILIMRRQNDDGGGGQWDIPGGAIEDGENQPDALKREVFEETNLKIDTIKKIKKITLKIPESGINSDMNIYSANALSSDVELKPADWKGSDGKPEHTELAWIEYKDELENRPMLDILKKVVMKYLK
jgi:8-oxo-dGTP pyrophosphatase MutT (NUDIX family)